MTLRHLEIFSAVCVQESFTRAAEQLNMAQPAVSLAIRELEGMAQNKGWYALPGETPPESPVTEICENGVSIDTQ